MKTFSPQISAKELTALQNIRTRAEKYGYSRIESNVLGSQARKRALTDFLVFVEKMPAEPYDEYVTRRRFVTYAHFYKPHEHEASLLYFIEPEYDIDVGAKLFRYGLSKEYNPYSPGTRKFAPVPDGALEHGFLHEIIEAGFHAVPLQPEYRRLPIEVEVQFIRYEPRRDREAVGTPPTTHQDNDWAFCVFLLEWENIEGPINAFVAAEHSNKPLKDVPENAVKDILLLVDKLEGYCVEDTKVAHYVGPVRLKQGAEYGRRTIVILSYKPLVPLRPADVKKTVEMFRNKPELLKEPPSARNTIELDDISGDVLPSRTRTDPQTILLIRSRYA